MKSLFALALTILAATLSSCTPALQNALADSLNSSNQTAQQERAAKARQAAVERNPPIIGARCVSRDGQVRLNLLRQGPNACLFAALAPLELGEIARVDAAILLRFSSKPDVRYVESYGSSDAAFRGSRIGYLLPIMMPDSLTGAVLSLGIGVGKIGISQLLQARYEFLQGQVSVSLPPLDAKTARYFDGEGNIRDAESRFGNLGQRPSFVGVQLRVCAVDGVCVLSPVTELATR